MGFLLPVLSACGSLSAPFLTLDGDWHTAYNPGGGGITLSLETSATALSGTFAVTTLMSRPAGAGTIAGEWASPWFALTLTYTDSTVATYVGRLVGGSQLQGTWTPPLSSAEAPGDLTFYRP